VQNYSGQSTWKKSIFKSRRAVKTKFGMESRWKWFRTVSDGELSNSGVDAELTLLLCSV
jgi:hypothetical protein